MIKYIGVLFIFLFCVFVGVQYADSLSYECRKLSLMCEMLFDIKNCISYESMTYAELIDFLGRGGRYDSFSFLSDKFGKETIKYEVLDTLEKSKVFKEQEYNERLIRIFTLIGSSDKQSQLDMICSNQDFFERQAEKLQNELDTKRRLYISLGFAAGVMISILLI